MDKCSEIIKKLTDSNRHEDKRFEDMTTALQWLTSELVRFLQFFYYLS